MSETNYQKYRGRCKELSEQAVKNDPNLTLVRGWYWCPISNKEEMHWWTTRPDGTIYDPTAKQFLSNGIGEYREFDGNYTCDECGKIVSERECTPMGNYVACSTKCAMRLVGL